MKSSNDNGAKSKMALRKEAPVKASNEIVVREINSTTFVQRLDGAHANT